MISEIDMDGNGNIISVTIMPSSILGSGPTVYPLNTRMSHRQIYEPSGGNEVLIRAPYASIARSMFLEAMWPTRKAMPSRSTSLIIVHSVTRRWAYSGEISCG